MGSTKAERMLRHPGQKRRGHVHKGRLTRMGLAAGCVVIGSALRAYRGTRVGEAANPGPYEYGGASSSGVAVTGPSVNKEDSALADRKREGSNAAERSATDWGKGGRREKGTKGAEGYEEEVGRGGKGESAEDDWLWEQEQWIIEREEEILQGDGVGAGLDRGHADMPDWAGHLADEIECLTQGELARDQGEGDEERGQAGEDSWWAMHDRDLVAMAKASKTQGETSSKLAISLVPKPWDERELPCIDEERQMANECVQRSRLDQVDWGKLQEQLDQQARDEAKVRYAKWEKSLGGIRARPGNIQKEDSTKEAQERRAAWANEARGGTNEVMIPPELEEGKGSGHKKGKKKMRNKDEQRGGTETSKRDEERDGSREPAAAPKRRRRKERGPAEIWCVNTSGRPQLERVVRAAKKQKGEAAVIAILNQEHQQSVDKMRDLQHWIKKEEWEGGGANAVTTDRDGTSAGVMIAVPKGVAMGVNEGLKCDRSPKEAPGRLAVAWIQQVIPGGLVCASLYTCGTQRRAHRGTGDCYRKPSRR